jgi:hypothetical protein
MDLLLVWGTLHWPAIPPRGKSCPCMPAAEVLNSSLLLDIPIMENLDLHNLWIVWKNFYQLSISRNFVASPLSPQLPKRKDEYQSKTNWGLTLRGILIVFI